MLKDQFLNINKQNFLFALYLVEHRNDSEDVQMMKTFKLQQENKIADLH